MGIYYKVTLLGSELRIRATQSRATGFGTLRAAKAQARDIVKSYGKQNNIFALRIVASWTRAQVVAGTARINVA